MTIRNITLRNVAFTNSLLMPGVLLCDPKNPCTGFVFDNVTVTPANEFLVQNDWVCQNVLDARFQNVSPPIKCKTTA